MAGSRTSWATRLILSPVRDVHMHTKLTPDNPHGYNRYGFAWQSVPGRGTAHLDFGCYDGAFLATLKSKGIARLIGADISQDAVQKARERYPDVEIVHISRIVPLPFENGAFASVTLLDVLEHVNEQEALLCELNRVLRKDGTLIVTVPGQHIFSFLDVGNLKFRFPTLHKWYYCVRHSKADYEYRYILNPNGLVGDVSARKHWHEHFSRRRLCRLLEGCAFEVIEFDGTGFFTRILKVIQLLSQPIRPLRSLLRWFESLDARFFESANLFCVAKKIGD